MTDIGLLADALHRLGTRCVFGIPGEGASLELLTELERSECRFHAVGHEGAAALMAGGYGRTAGIPGVSLSIKGPGFANMLAGITTNWLDRNPALSLSESYGPGSSPDRMHKRLPHGAMVKHVVKAYADNPSPDLLPQLWKLASAEEPGPVHLDISATLSGRAFECPSLQPVPTHAPAGVIARIRAAQRPVVVAGAVATRRTWRHKLASLRLPIFTTVAGKGALDEALPWAGGVMTNNGGPVSPEQAIVPLADLVIGIGLRTTELLGVRPFDSPLVLLDELPDRGGGLQPVAQALCDDSGVLEALDLLTEKEWGLREMHDAKGTLAGHLRSDRWLPAQAFAAMQAMLPANTRFVLDTGSFCTVGEHVLIAQHPDQVIGSASGRSMGVALPFGIGSALARPVPTAIVLGDGGVRMYPETFTVAVRERLPILVVLMADGSYGSIRRAAAAGALAQRPLIVDSACWEAVFHGFGASTARAESLAELDAVLDLWRRAPSPLFLELCFDPDRYLFMTDGIR